MKAAVARELARDPDADGIGKPVGEIARVAVNLLRETKTFDTALYGRVSDQVDGRPAQSVQHTGTITLVPMILEGAPADMLEEGEIPENMKEE